MVSKSIHYFWPYFIIIIDFIDIFYKKKRIQNVLWPQVPKHQCRELSQQTCTSSPLISSTEPLVSVTYPEPILICSPFHVYLPTIECLVKYFGLNKKMQNWQQNRVSGCQISKMFHSSKVNNWSRCPKEMWQQVYRYNGQK